MQEDRRQERDMAGMERGKYGIHGKYEKHGIHKAKGGILRVSVDADERIRDIMITGDFFFFPEEAIEELERSLVGVRVEEEELLKTVADFYRKWDIESPGIEYRDFVTAIRKACCLQI